MVMHHGWHGRYFEDFVVGDIHEHPLGWTEFGRPLVNSAFTLALDNGTTAP